MATALAAQGASGALEISGDPGGTSYLTEGYLTFAESAAVPDLGSRLVNSRRVLVDQWSRADQDSQPAGCAGDLPQSRKRDKQEISWSAVDSGGTKPDGRGRDARSGGQRKPRLGTATPVTDRNLERPRDRVRGPWAPAVGRGTPLPQRSPPSSGPMPPSAELT